MRAISILVPIEVVKWMNVIRRHNVSTIISSSSQAGEVDTAVVGSRVVTTYSIQLFTRKDLQLSKLVKDANALAFSSNLALASLSLTQ